MDGREHLEDYSEIGRALDAEMVVGIDLTGFQLYQGQTLYQGRAEAEIHVVGLKKEEEKDKETGEKTTHKKWEDEFSRSLPEVVYPPNTSIATSEWPESVFRRKFIMTIADRIGRYFYQHDPHADIGLDAEANRGL